MYILDEEKIIKNRIYEGYLDNEDVNQLSILIYTDKKLSGTKLNTYSVVKINNKIKIRITANDGPVYISYECRGEESRVPDINISVKDEEVIPGKDYLDAELYKKADKINTFTKREIIEKLNGISSGSTNYNDLENKPKIQSVELEGDKTFQELGAITIEDAEISSLF